MTMTKWLLLIQTVVLLTACLGVLAQRFQWLPFKLAFGCFVLSLLAAAIIGLLAVLGIVVSCLGGPGLDRILAAVIAGLGLLPLLIIAITVGKGLRVPAVHDISTDITQPVLFRHAPSLRSSDENPLTPPSPELLRQQQDFYSELKPLIVTEPPAEAFRRSKLVAQSLGWQLVWQAESDFQFEATSKTALFGFIDDIAVRVTEAKGSEGFAKIDLRSVSRVGRSDLGANAARIRDFQEHYAKSRLSVE